MSFFIKDSLLTCYIFFQINNQLLILIDHILYCIPQTPFQYRTHPNRKGVPQNLITYPLFLDKNSEHTNLPQIPQISEYHVIMFSALIKQGGSVL